MEKLKISRYQTELEGNKIAYYAVAGKKKVRMPDAFHDMYTPDYLCIQHVEPERPEIYGEKGGYWIPLRTSP